MAKTKDYDKFAVLKYLFMQKTNNATTRIGEDIDFTLDEIGDGIRATGGTAPTSWSNFVLDLTRKDNTIYKRLPAEIISYGYDLRKKTGKVPGTTDKNFCGTFIYRGFDNNGNTIPLKDWLIWGMPDRTIVVKNKVPPLVQRFISNDEASLFSVIDYCDILSIVLNQPVFRVQSPMKWQPNEIDGYYASQDTRNTFVYPVEAKAQSTDDDINLVQIYGQYTTFIEKYKKNDHSLIVRPIAVKMQKDGMLLAVMEHNSVYDPVRNRNADMFNITSVVKIEFDSPLQSWKNKK